MQRLGSEALAQIDPQVRRPRYDRRALEIGMAHIGVGAFHRCHQAEYTDDMLEAAFGCWGVVGVNLKPPRLTNSLGAQDGLFSRTLKRGHESETRVIGCLKRVIDLDDDANAETAISALAAPAIGTITMTLTEKGYCHIPATGALDRSNADLAHDLTAPAQPRTALGLLLAVFERRRQDCAGPVTVISCDNLPSNGRILERVLMEFARSRSAATRSWIADNVAFVSTMVDRIVPATTTEDIEAVSRRLGARDLCPVVGEPFRQWVIEDRFAGARPPWNLAGAQFVPNVEPYENIKMRVLNAAQSTLSHLGPFLSYDFSHQAAANPVLAGLVRRMLEEETAPTLPDVEGMAVGPYIESAFERIGNTATQHRCHQIGTDGSQKIVQRILRPLQQCLSNGQPAPFLTLAAASWIAYVLAGSARFGRRWAPSDPFAARVISLADTPGGDMTLLARQVLGIEQIFGAGWPSNRVDTDVARHLAGLLSPEPMQYLAAVLAGQ